MTCCVCRSMAAARRHSCVVRDTLLRSMAVLGGFGRQGIEAGRLPRQLPGQSVTQPERAFRSIGFIAVLNRCGDSLRRALPDLEILCGHASDQCQPSSPHVTAQQLRAIPRTACSVSPTRSRLDISAIGTAYQYAHARNRRRHELHRHPRDRGASAPSSSNCQGTSAFRCSRHGQMRSAICFDAYKSF